jgi:hypothetical protein
MLPLLKRHEIQVLLRAGHAQKDVAERTGTSSDTVARVKREDDVVSVDDAAEHRHRRIGRPSKATPFAPRVSAWLAEEPDLPTQELLRRAMEAGVGSMRLGSSCFGLVARSETGNMIRSVDLGASRSATSRAARRCAVWLPAERWAGSWTRSELINRSTESVATLSITRSVSAVFSSIRDESFTSTRSIEAAADALNTRGRC